MTFKNRSWNTLTRRASFLCAAMLLTMTTAGCATLQGDPPLAVSLPDDCDRLAKPVPYPPIVKGEDLGVRSGKYAAALGQANGRLSAAGKCNEAVRAQFEKK